MKKPSFVYAISDGTFIKIGVSTSPEKRLKTLSTGCAKKLILLGYFPGGFDLESTLHDTHFKVRNNGEWFKPTAELLDYLNSRILNKFITVKDGQVISYLRVPIMS